MVSGSIRNIPPPAPGHGGLCQGSLSALFFGSTQGLSSFGLHHRQQIAHVNVAVEFGLVRRCEGPASRHLAQFVPPGGPGSGVPVSRLPCFDLQAGRS